MKLQSLQIIIIFMSNIPNKLNQIRSDMRREDISSLMQRKRAFMQRSSDEQLFNDIYSTPPHHFKQQQHLAVLIELVNKDMTAAIAHLGNLVIDRLINAEMLASVSWKIGVNQKWTWLINAFSQIEYSTPQLFQHCVKRIITKRSTFNLINALEYIIKSLKHGLSQIECISHNPELVLALSNHAQAHDSEDKISLYALTIFSTATSQDQKIPQDIYRVLGQERLSEMILFNLRKIRCLPRALACQIANNFVLSGIDLESVRLKMLLSAPTENERVKLEISYYLKGFAENASGNMILFYIKNHGLLEILNSFSKIHSENTKYDQQISQNATQTQAIIQEKFNTAMNYEMEYQMNGVQKMLDESEAQTIYEQQSNGMID